MMHASVNKGRDVFGSKFASTLMRFQKAPFSKSCAFNRINVDIKQKRN